jgi:hypothetical protein
MPGPPDLGTLEDDNRELYNALRVPSPVAAAPQTFTRSGRSVRFPRRMDDFLPVMRTALAHIIRKKLLNCRTGMYSITFGCF